MNITRLKIENFKCFGEETEIPFAPLTLIYGENGAGKSAMLQAVQLLVNNMKERSLPAAQTPAFKEHPVEAHQPNSKWDDFCRLSHNANKTLSISVGIEYQYMQESTGSVECSFDSFDGNTPAMKTVKMSPFGPANAIAFVTDTLYTAMKARRKTIQENYTRFIEYLIIQNYFAQHKEIHKVIREKSSIGIDHEYGVQFEEEKIHGSFCDGLEDWILFGIPDWSEYRSGQEYQLAKTIMTDDLCRDIEFFSRDFSLDEFRERYQTEIETIYHLAFSTVYSRDKSEFQILTEVAPPQCDKDIPKIVRDLAIGDNPAITLRADLDWNAYQYEHEVRMNTQQSFEFVRNEFGWFCNNIFPQHQVRTSLYAETIFSYIGKTLTLAVVHQIDRQIATLKSAIISEPPLREAPKDFYDGKSLFGSVANDPALRRQLNAWLNKLGTGYEVEFMFNKEYGASLLLFDTRGQKNPSSYIGNRFWL